MKAKEGEFSLETDYGLFDLVNISKDLKETQVLSILKNDLLKEGKFIAPKNGNICFASIAAFIIYIDSICTILDTTNDTNTTH